MGVWMSYPEQITFAAASLPLLRLYSLRLCDQNPHLATVDIWDIAESSDRY